MPDRDQASSEGGFVVEGYTRDPQMTERLIQAVRDALHAFPQQRLGQILINTETALFYLTDEELEMALRSYIARGLK